MKDIVKTIVVNLKPSEEELWEQIHKNARWGVRRAQKEGLKIEAAKHFKEWYKIYLESMKEKGITPFFPEEIQRQTLQYLTCTKNGKVIAGLIISLDRDTNTPEVEYNASLAEYQKDQPNDLLYWSAILWAKKHGYDKIDLGGYAVKPYGELIGINKFKEKWSTNIISTKHNYPIMHALQRKILRNSPTARKIKVTIRRYKNKKSQIYEKAAEKQKNL